MTPLAKLVNDAMEKNSWSCRDLAAHCDYMVSHATFNNIARGQAYPNGHSRDTLRGIALALGEPLDKVLTAAAASSAAGRARVLPAEADRLTDGQWQAVNDLIIALAS